MNEEADNISHAVCPDSEQRAPVGLPEHDAGRLVAPGALAVEVLEVVGVRFGPLPSRVTNPLRVGK